MTHRIEAFARPFLYSASTSCLFALLALASDARGQQTLLTDNFGTTSLDTGKWSMTSYRGSRARSSGGHLLLEGRALVSTKGQFDPRRIDNLRVTGSWRCKTVDDYMQILTRSDGVPTEKFGETRSGLEFNAEFGGNTISIRARGTDIATGRLAFAGQGTLPLAPGVTYDFEIQDLGNTASFTVWARGNRNIWRRVNTSVTRSNQASNRIVFHNREGSKHKAHVDDIQITSKGFSTYRSGCRSSTGKFVRLSSTGNFRLGQRTTIQADGLAANKLGVIVISVRDDFWGANPLPLSLGALGAPKCAINVDWQGLTYFIPSDSTGRATMSLLVPNLQHLRGTVLYSQYLSVDRGANAAGLCLSNAGKGAIGR